MKKVMSVLALCGLLALSGGSAFAAQWKLAHIRPADSVIERDLQAFAKEVREATSGRIDIRIYGSSQLGDYTVVQEKVSLGSVEMSCESVSTQVDKRFLSYILPYVAKDYATAKKNFGTGTPYAKYCANLFDKQDIMVLANWPVYFGGIGLVKAPEAPADPNASHHEDAGSPCRRPRLSGHPPAVRGILHRRPDRHGLRHLRRRRGKLLRLLPGSAEMLHRREHPL